MTDNIQKVNNPKSYTPCKDLLERNYLYRAQNMASAETLITELHTCTERNYLCKLAQAVRLLDMHLRGSSFESQLGHQLQ